MKLTKLTADDTSTLAVEMLGLDPESIDLMSVEGLAASLRRAASFMCPTSPGRLVDAVLGTLQPIHEDGLSRDSVTDVLDQLVASGDLLELRHESGRSTRLLFLAPPSYVERVAGTYLLMGVRPFGAPLIEDHLALSIEYEGHTRILRIESSEADDRLRARGLKAVPKNRWVSSPAVEAPSDLIDRYRARLVVAGEAGQLEGLALLDPATKVSFYKGRWRAPDANDSGDFIARRPQAYGADLWCLIHFDSGVAQRLIELPMHDPLVPGRDEAWRYQAAVDALQGRPQRYRVRPGATPNDDVVVDFFSPLPGFAERYVQFAGQALGKNAGALFSFRLPIEATGDVSSFLTEMLWMTREESANGG